MTLCRALDVGATGAERQDSSGSHSDRRHVLRQSKGDHLLRLMNCSQPENEACDHKIIIFLLSLSSSVLDSQRSCPAEPLITTACLPAASMGWQDGVKSSTEQVYASSPWYIEVTSAKHVVGLISNTSCCSPVCMYMSLYHGEVVVAGFTSNSIPPSTTWYEFAPNPQAT